MDIIRRSAKEWADLSNIDIVSDLLKGFETYRYFYDVRITKEEFDNRISKCEIIFKKQGLYSKDINNYSMYKSAFSVHPELEQIAHEEIDKMGNDYLLEGATKIGGGFFRLWYKRFKEKKLNSIDLPIDPEKRKTVRVKANLILPPISSPIKTQKNDDGLFLIHKRDYTKIIF